MLDGEPYHGSAQNLTHQEAEVLLIGKAQSFINVPIFVEDQWWGFIGFDDMQANRAWSVAEVGALKIAAGLLGTVLQGQRSELARQESEHLVQVLGDNLPGGAIYQVITYPDGSRRFTYISEGIKTLSGLSAKQTQEDAKLLYDRIYTEDRLAFGKLEEECVRSKKVFDTQARLMDANDEIRWCHFRSAPRAKSGGIIVWDGLIQDINDRVEAEAEIRMMNQKLEQRVADRTAELEAINRELLSFSYSVSHDLRAPLRAINGYSSLLTKDYGDQLDDQAHLYLKNIRKGAVHMSQLINDLLQFSRLARVEVNTSQVDLSDMVRQTLLSLQALEPERQIVWRVQDGLTAKADPALLKIVIENLIGNAWKFTQKNEKAEIIFGHQIRDGNNVFYIRDNGVGFDMNYAQRIFDPFERLHTPDEFEGTGIGLATADRIIKRHGGQIWTEAKPGIGATFYFQLD